MILYATQSRASAQLIRATRWLAADKFARSPSPTNKDLAFLRVDGATARRLEYLEKVYRLADALG
jgi:hypothetical protein